MTNKMTKKDYFKNLLEVVQMNELPNGEDLTNFINHELELLERKAQSRAGGTSKRAKENTEIANLVMTEMARLGKPTTITDLLKNSQALADYVTEDGKALSNQKMSAILNSMVKTAENPEGKFTKLVDKRVTLFYVA